MMARRFRPIAAVCCAVLCAMSTMPSLADTPEVIVAPVMLLQEPDALPPLSSVSLLATAPVGDVRMRVLSFRERRYLSTIRQQKDFSCGSAAVATLLTHHYAMPTSEAEALSDMVAHGDQAIIERDGFSLLDIRNFLARRGLRADGFRAPLDRLVEIGVPAIALIDNDGYKHFVVVRGLTGTKVLLADPNAGTRTMDRHRFEAIWNGVLFVILDRADIGRATFARASDWNARPSLSPQDAVTLLSSWPPFMGFPDGRIF